MTGLSFLHTPFLVCDEESTFPVVKDRGVWGALLVDSINPEMEPEWEMVAGRATPNRKGEARKASCKHSITVGHIYYIAGCV